MLIAGLFDRNLGGVAESRGVSRIGGNLGERTFPCEAGRAGEGSAAPYARIQPITHLHVWQRTTAQIPD